MGRCFTRWASISSIALRSRSARAASLGVWVMEPKNGGVPRGTIVALPGLGAKRFFLLPPARDLAHAGYRVVLVDLRGQGRSSGNFITYGVVESRDVSQVIDDLEKRKLIAGKIGLFGMSFGAATAIETAAHDPRVQAVVSLASFATMRQEVPHYGRVMVPVVGWVLSDRGYTAAITAAGKLAGFDPDAASPVEAIRQTRAPVLLIHGNVDTIVPLEQGKQLHAAAPDHSELLIVRGAGHVGPVFFPLDSFMIVSQKTTDWFNRYLIVTRNAER